MDPFEFFSHWNQIRAGLLSTIEAFNDDELFVVPYQGSWPIGQIMLHIAGAEDGWLRYVVTRELDEWPDQYNIDNFQDRDSILQILDQVHSRSLIYLSKLKSSDLNQQVKTPWGKEITLHWIIWHIIEHEIHHRGELSLILGYLGREGLDV